MSVLENNKIIKCINADGECRIHISMEKNKISKYANSVLLSNKCDALLEMRTVYDQDNIEVYYLTHEMETVENLICKNPKFNILECISIMLHTLKRCEDFLIKPEELLLAPENIYYEENNHDLRFMYYPHSTNIMSVREAIISMIDKKLSLIDIKALDVDYLLNYKNDIFYKEQYGINNLIRITEEASRSCQISKQNVNLEIPHIEEIKVEEEESFYEYDISRDKGKILDLGSRLKTMLVELVS